MANGGAGNRFIFPKWSNALLPFLIINALGVPPFILVVAVFALSPRTTDVGYMPTQPVEYSHTLHAGELGIDCRYCHNTVESARFAAIPPTQTCMNCHSAVASKSDPDKLAPVKQSHETGQPIIWRKVHDLPDYAYFSHAAHVNKGVSCVECHDRVDRMDVVYQAETLSMGWCLTCHRDPAPNLRPREEVTNLAWGMNMSRDELIEFRQELKDQYDIDLSPRDKDQNMTGRRDLTSDERREIGEQLIKRYRIKSRPFMESCTTCHR